MTEVSPDPYSQPEYDWRVNEQDWRFRLSASLPFGLLLIALSLRRSKQEPMELSGGRGIAMVSPDPYSQPEYDWRVDELDWRYRLSASLPFGLLLLALSPRRATQAWPEELSGGRGIAMVSVRGQGQPSPTPRPRQTLAEWITM
jgi:hypothetical protein